MLDTMRAQPSREHQVHLGRVAVKNFRNLEDFEITFGPGLNVIVGANNSGKTNLVDAIRLALGSEGIEDSVRLIREDWTLDAQGAPTAGSVRVDLEFHSLDASELAQFLDIVAYDFDNPLASKALLTFEATWSTDSERASRRRWGGGREQSDSGVPDEILQALRTTFLKALRDAETGLSPSRRNRLARLLARRASDAEQTELVDLMKKANKDLEGLKLVQRVEQNINEGLGGVTDERFDRTALVRASSPSFDRVVHNLRLVLKDPLCPDSDPEELVSNGLGYNNLLYTVTVLTELANLEDTARPILLIEEPEAHLHPQLQTLLVDFLSNTKTEAGTPIQVIVTTHSPTVAAHVPPETIIVMHRPKGSALRAAAIRDVGLDKRELRELRRMLDVTRAAMLFASGVILVEGISEELLVPAIAAATDRPLGKTGVSVVPVCGVAFETLAKIFGVGRVELPVAIVTDGDPGIVDSSDSSKDALSVPTSVPKKNAAGLIETCARTSNLVAKHNQDPSLVRVFHSQVTLEHDLAAECADNASIIAAVWKSLYEPGTPRSLTPEKVAGCSSDEERGLVVWRGVCLSSPAVGKPELAMRLADALVNPAEYDALAMDKFKAPSYLTDAIGHVLSTGGPSCPTT